MAWHNALCYDLTEHEGAKDTWAIRITQGPFAGVEYAYGKVGAEEQGDGSAVLSFEYVILETTEACSRDLLDNSEEFKTHIGDILSDLIIDEVKETENASESRDDNTSKSTDQRAVRASGYSVSEG